MIVAIVLAVILQSKRVENLEKIEERGLPSPVITNNQIQNQYRPIIIAHRGASGMYPEHTKLAYR